MNRAGLLQMAIRQVFWKYIIDCAASFAWSLNKRTCEDWVLRVWLSDCGWGSERLKWGWWSYGLRNPPLGFVIPSPWALHTLPYTATPLTKSNYESHSFSPRRDTLRVWVQVFKFRIQLKLFWSFVGTFRQNRCVSSSSTSYHNIDLYTWYWPPISFGWCFGSWFGWCYHLFHSPNRRKR